MLEKNKIWKGWGVVGCGLWVCKKESVVYTKKDGNLEISKYPTFQKNPYIRTRLNTTHNQQPTTFYL